MASSSDQIYGLQASRVNVGTGATLAFFLDVVPGQISTVIKYLSGGTLEIIGCTTNAAINDFSKAAQGTTYSAADLASLSGTGYLMATNEVLSFAGPIRCYLSSTGATTIVHIIKGRSEGNG